MEIGETIRYRRRAYWVMGFDPHSVVPQCVYLIEVSTRMPLVLALDDLDRDRNCHLRLVEPPPADPEPATS